MFLGKRRVEERYGSGQKERGNCPTHHSFLSTRNVGKKTATSEGPPEGVTPSGESQALVRQEK